jgi:hypothetical protein
MDNSLYEQIFSRDNLIKEIIDYENLVKTQIKNGQSQIYQNPISSSGILIDLRLTVLFFF